MNAAAGALAGLRAGLTGKTRLKRPATLAVLAGMVALVAAIPVLFVAASAFQLSPERWLGLWTTRLPGLLWNTLTLSVLVAAGCFILGVSSAWLVARREFPGRRIATWLMILPLAIPTYVFAYIYTVLLERDGWLGGLWLSVFGADAALPTPFNLWGVAAILSLAGFPYVFLLTRAAVSRSSRSIEEAARIQGAGPWRRLFSINLPLLRPAIAAGLALVTLHVLSDFGAVSMLRFQTFTLGIYLQLSGRFDFTAAAGLSFILVLLSLSFLVLERFFRQRQRYYASGQARPVTPRRARGRELLLIWGWLGLVALFAFILPAAWIIHWSWKAWLAGQIDAQFWGYVGNSLELALLGACLAVIIALPVALYHKRRHSPVSGGFLQISSVGFVLPGPVMALGILTFMLALLPGLYGSIAALLLALVILFLPIAIQSQESALQQLSPSVEQASRALGAGPLETLWRVTLPVIRGGLASAWVLVFIDILKELPATLILRPTGFDTLPVRIWLEASEEMLRQAAPAALMLVLGTLPALIVMMRGERRAERGR